MKKITPAELEEGMKLARTLTDQMGRVLLEKGEVLSAAFVEKLKSWPIEIIYIESGDEQVEEVSADEIEAQIAKIREAVERNFEGIKDPNMLTIKKNAGEFLEARLRERLE